MVLRRPLKNTCGIVSGWTAILQIGKLRLGEATWLAQVHRARKW